MIQFNLLPDVKLQFIKAKRIERIAFTISTIAIIVSLVILLFLLSLVDGIQKKSLSDLNKDITTYTGQIEGTPNLNKILTVQNQLDSLPALDAQKPAVSQLFTYIADTTPTSVDISSLDIDFGAHTIELSGTADTLSSIDQFVDTLKFTTYKTSAANSVSTDAFSSVLLASFDRTSSGASYSITANFDPAIFNSANVVTLTVPPEITTRSDLDQPKILFNAPSTSSSTTNNSQ